LGDGTDDLDQLASFAERRVTAGDLDAGPGTVVRMDHVNPAEDFAEWNVFHRLGVF
jgi:hypothetical protein